MRALVIVVALGAVGCKRRREEPGPPASLTEVTKKDPAIEQRRKAAVEVLRKRDPEAFDDFSGPPCAVPAPRPPEPLGAMNLQWSGPDGLDSRPGGETYGYLLTYWRFTGSDFDVIARDGLGTPFEHEAFDEVEATVIIDRYRDPIFQTETRYIPGELVGRVVLWRDGAAACGASVRVVSSQITVVSQTSADYRRRSSEDPLSKARIDLVNEALRAGLPALRQAVPPRPDCAHAPAGTVALIDVRGAARIADAAFLDDVAKLLAKEPAPPPHRIWLFAGTTFDPWQKDSYATEVARWKAFLARHPATKDEIVIDKKVPNNGVLVERLVEAGLEERKPAKLCAKGAERDLLELAPPAKGLKLTVVANP